MQVSKISSFNSVNKGIRQKKNNQTVSLLNTNNEPSQLQTVSFQGNWFKAIGKLFERPVASKGKYPLNLKDLLLRLNESEIKYKVSKAARDHVWVKTTEQEFLFMEKGKVLKQVHTSQFLQISKDGGLDVRKESVYFQNDGKTLERVQKYDKEGRETKRIDYSPYGLVKEITNYKPGGIKNWVEFDIDGVTVKRIKKPIPYGSGDYIM